MILFVAVVVTTICCFLCSCCYLYRRRQQLQSPFEGMHSIRQGEPEMGWADCCQGHQRDQGLMNSLIVSLFLGACTCHPETCASEHWPVSRNVWEHVLCLLCVHAHAHSVIHRSVPVDGKWAVGISMPVAEYMGWGLW